MQVYDAQKGTFTELGMLDVQQIFGRAGRPQVGVCFGIILWHSTFAFAVQEKMFRFTSVLDCMHLALCKIVQFLSPHTSD